MPTVPAVARLRTDDGAEAFVRFYFDLTNKGLQDPSHQKLGDFSDKNCVACKRTQDFIKGFADDDQRLDQDLYTVSALALATKPSVPTVILNATLELERSEIVTTAGKPTGRFVKASTLKRQIGLKWVNDAWVLYGME